MAPNTKILDTGPATTSHALRREGRAWLHGFPLSAVATSVLAHAALIAVFMNTTFGPGEPVLEDSVITLRLGARPVIDEKPPVAESPTEDPLPITVPETRTVAQPSTEPDVAVGADARPETDSPKSDESIARTDRVQTGTLRATLLDQIRSLPAESDNDARTMLPWPSTGESIPGMPGMRGWISGYAGTAAPSAQTWKENDGSSRGRYVLADGTVICTRRRAPTVDELMNPWKSIAVTMSGLCGRQRAEPVDYSDPRVQPPPFSGAK